MYQPEKPHLKKVLDFVKTTWETPYVSVRGGVIKKKFSYPEVFHVDGIGTKGLYHWQKRTFAAAVQDALAMNLNDMLYLRATPYAVTDHIFVPEDGGEAIIEIIKNLSLQCKKFSIAIAGGESAHCDTSKELEISLSMMGFVKKPRENRFEVGDILIGIASSGLHANGFTKVRQIFGEYFRDEFVAPTAIYYPHVAELAEKFSIQGMMHITGGAFTKLKPLLYGADARISEPLEPQPIFREMCKRGVSDAEMYRTFNCGNGFVLGISPKSVNAVIAELKKYFKAKIIGEVTKGDGSVVIRSYFSKSEVVY